MSWITNKSKQLYVGSRKSVFTGPKRPMYFATTFQRPSRGNSP